MKVDVFPSSLSGAVDAPGSKSIAQRMVAAALLAKGESTIANYPDSADCATALSVAQNLGAIITRTPQVVKIKGGFPNSFHADIRNPKKTIDCGESGLASRLFTPIAALHKEAITVNGEGSLLTRPFQEFEIALPPLGAKVDTTNGHLPLTVKGPLVGGHVVLDGGISSQFITGLLMALPRASKPSEVVVKNVTSTPYLQMTLEVLKQFEVKVKHKNFETFTIDAAQTYVPQNIAVPGDWSGAAFLLVAAALCADAGKVVINNLSTTITQADAQILNVLEMAGITATKTKDSYSVQAATVNAFEFDANQCPDLFPPLAALAAFANGVSTIYGIKRLVHKESNRAKVLQEEFAKANIRIVLRDDEMKIYPSGIRPAIINAHNDHRIAMAAALLGLGGAKMTIKGAECVAKSYPHFFEDIKSLGGKVIAS